MALQEVFHLLFLERLFAASAVLARFEVVASDA
jgi:hypothetical protein